MSTNAPFTKENLDACLKELAKEYRKRSGNKMPAEIILIGGAAVLANYGFREMTYDIDAVILASTVMKESINQVGDKLGLPNGWMNADFKRTKSYSDKLAEVSTYYRTFSNILTVRTVAAEYLIAMKLMAGRQYKNDLSDIAGILWEHEQKRQPITWTAVDKAVCTLYGDWEQIPASSRQLLDDAFAAGDYGRAYREIRESEQRTKEILLDFNAAYPGAVKEDNLEAVLAQAKRRRQVKEQIEPKSIEEREPLAVKLARAQEKVAQQQEKPFCREKDKDLQR